MKVKDIIRKPTKVEQMLQEALSSEFTFGFELEAICKKPADNDFYIPSYHGYSEENQPLGLAKEVKKELDKWFGEGKIEQDSSLQGEHEEWTFEYASPKISFNPLNMKRLYEMLTSLSSMDIYTNDTCGFHIHFSFPDIDKKEAAWIICCIAIDNNLKEYIKVLTTKTGEIESLLYDYRYADPGFFQAISQAIADGYYDTLSRLLDNTKKRSLRIHPQGTIEWRGPRGFLNKGDPEIIKLMIQKLYNFVLKLSKITSVQKYSGEAIGKEVTLEKKDLLSKLNLYDTKFDSEIEKEKEDKSKKIENLLSKNPYLILKMSADKINKIFNSSRVAIIFALNECLFQESNFRNLDKKVFNALLECWLKYYVSSEKIDYNSHIGEKIFEFLRTLFSTYVTDTNTSYDEAREFMKGFPYTKKLDNNKISALKQYLSTMPNPSIVLSRKLFKDLDIVNSKEFKETMKSFDERKYFLLVKFLKGDLPKFVLDEIYKHKFFNVFSVIQLPTNYQMKLVKQNPYYIQYIFNPSQKVVDYVKNKDENALEYMLGDKL